MVTDNCNNHALLEPMLTFSLCQLYLLDITSINFKNLLRFIDGAENNGDKI
jgi:hypothetical protein